MKANLFLFLLLAFTALSTKASSDLTDREEIINSFLFLAQDENNQYSLDFYDSIQSNTKLPEIILFCHIAKSLRLIISDIPRATKELIQAKTIYAASEDLDHYEAYIDMAEGKLYTSLGDYEKSYKLLSKVVNEFDANNQITMKVIAQYYMINLFVQQGQIDLAHQLLSTLFRKLSPKLFTTKEQYEKFEMVLWNQKATLLTTISNIQKDSLESAKQVLMYVIEMAKERGDEQVYFNSTGNLSYIYYLNHEYEKMIPLALKDLSYSISKNSVESIGGLHTVLADSYFQLGQIDSASFHLKKAEDYSKHLRNKYFHEIFVDVAHRYYKASGDVESAFEALNRQYDAINEIYKSITQINFDLSKAENDLSQAEERIEYLNLKNRQNIVINWLLGLLALCIGLLAFNFYRLQHAQKRFRNKLEHINQTLESEIERRTKEVVEQSDKIKAAAYHNSHRTRAPVARLLGLVDILNTEIPSEREEIAEYIRQSAREIDEVIIDMNEVLSNRSE
ncbi:MAG: hypothetical protein ABJH98_19080 [Reichenbachiella sp.]|uniref:hypothetical protein n=1 Tax=Reichenbachiella sp. TaxID=2184521 RepID=UPI00329700EA